MWPCKCPSLLWATCWRNGSDRWPAIGAHETRLIHRVITLHCLQLLSRGLHQTQSAGERLVEGLAPAHGVGRHLRNRLAAAEVRRELVDADVNGEYAQSFGARRVDVDSTLVDQFHPLHL